MCFIELRMLQEYIDGLLDPLEKKLLEAGKNSIS